MKKLLQMMLAAATLALAIACTPLTSHAMKQSDLAGKVYLMRTPRTRDGHATMYLFNGNGRKYYTCYVQINNDGQIKSMPVSRDIFNEAIDSKKGYYKHKADLNSVKDDGLRIRHRDGKDEIYMPTAQEWGTISGDTSEFYISRPGSNQSVSETFTLAPIQYKFKW